jgi:BirA family biotin operon repressor/biotin-[acetyl-CoA-carboxylase] ligase
VTRLDAAEVLRGLATHSIGRPLHLLASCPSTNDFALDLADHDAPHGTLVVADLQTAGRGQRGRTWRGAAGASIQASLVLRAAEPIGAPTLLVAAVGLGLAEGIEAATGLAPGIKWPNDLWAGGRKLAGILVESRGFRPQAPSFVAGFGVNVNQRTEDFPDALRATATSVALRTGRRHDLTALLRAILEALEPRVDQALGRSPAGGLDEAYRRRSVLVGQRVTLLDADAPLAGVVVDLSATHGLLLRTDDGRHRHVLAEHARDVRPESG